MTSERISIVVLGALVAVGCVRTGHRSPSAARSLVVAPGLDVSELRIPDTFTARLSGDSRLFADMSGAPMLITPGAVLSIADGRELPIDLAGASSAITLRDGGWLAGARGQVLLMRGSERVSARRVANDTVPVRVAPAGIVVAYVMAGSTLGLIDLRGNVRPIARFGSPITAVAGTGDLSFVALESGSVWMLRLGQPARPLHRHPSRITSMALDPNGYLVFSDDLTVYAMLHGRPLPLVAGIARAQLAASHNGVYAYSAQQRRLIAVENVVDVEAAVAR